MRDFVPIVGTMNTENATSNQNLWTTGQLAEASGLHQAHIRKLLERNVIHGQKYGHIWLVSDGEAQRWLQSREK